MILKREPNGSNGWGKERGWSSVCSREWLLLESTGCKGISIYFSDQRT